MNKRERKSRLKEVIKLIDINITHLEGNTKEIIKTAQTKIQDLYEYFENHCITPSDFDAEEMVRNILIEYIDNEDDIQEIIEQIESLREEVEEHIEEMREGSNKDEWEEFHSNLEYVEEIIDIEENNIDDIESFIENMKQLRANLQDLI